MTPSRPFCHVSLTMCRCCGARRCNSSFQKRIISKRGSQVGNILIEALHTPGHTPEHLAFLLTDTAATHEPMGLFTGDLLFVGDVGHPDLLEKAAGVTGTAESGARQLFRSLQRLRDLPDSLQIWPGHGAGSACVRAQGAVPQSTLGYEKRTNRAFGLTDEERFVRAVLDSQPDPPLYFAEMKRVNKVGPVLLRMGEMKKPEATMSA